MPKLTQDVTLWLTDELHKRLTDVIMAKENHPRLYYILVIMSDKYLGPPAVSSNHLINKTDRRGNRIGGRTVDLSGKVVVHNKIVCMDAPPMVPLLSTSLWRINNKIGEAKCVYILPPDKPIVLGSQMGEASKFIWKSAQGMPLVYSRN